MKIASRMLLFFLAFLLSFTSIEGQTKGLTVELIIPDPATKPLVKRFEVKDGQDLDAIPVGGVSATVDCIRCPLTSEFSFWLFRNTGISKDRSELAFSVAFVNRKRCNVEKSIKLDLTVTQEHKLKCGVKLRTYR